MREHLRHVDGVMLGRTAYHEPYRLAELEELYGTPLPDRDDVMGRLRPTGRHLARGERLQHITRHVLLGLYQDCSGHARSGACSARKRIVPTPDGIVVE